MVKVLKEEVIIKLTKPAMAHLTKEIQNYFGKQEDFAKKYNVEFVKFGEAEASNREGQEDQALSLIHI